MNDEHPPSDNTDYSSQTTLGKLFGVSSHQVGHWLIAIGLRTSEKKPSHLAFEGGYVQQAPTGRGTGYFYVWHQAKTIAALEAGGFHQRTQ